jgi:hypothetical protein
MLVNYAQEEKSLHTFPEGSLTNVLASGNVFYDATPVILGFAFYPLSSA